MDRSQQLRLLMKHQQAQKSAPASLHSTKEMVKQLKAQKVQAVQPAAKPAQSAAQPPSKPVAPAAARPALPQDFFDNAQEAAPPAVAGRSSAPTAPISAPPSAPAAAAPPAAKNNLPAGFFDDPVADLTARGVDIEALNKEVEKRQAEQVEDFLQQVSVEAEGIIELQEPEVEEVDIRTVLPGSSTGSEDLSEEDIVQMAYLASYARMLKQTESLGPASSMAVTAATMESLEAMLSETTALQPLHTAEPQAQQDVLPEELFLHRVQQDRHQRKRHLLVVKETPRRGDASNGHVDKRARSEEAEDEEDDEDEEDLAYDPMEYL